MATPQEMVNTIDKYMPGTSSDIAMMIPCHVNTLSRIRGGDNNIRHQLYLNIEKVYEKALEIKKVMES